MAPKSSGRIIAYEGLPPGWQAIEKDYLTGSMVGKSYIRFQTEKHKGVGSIRQALKLYAADNNMDPEQAIREFDARKAAGKDEEKKKREALGFMEGEKRDAAVEVFRSAYGKLDGATVSNLPGWKGESKLLENSGQICARYISPEGINYALLINIEAMFGLKIQNGEDIPDVDAARSGLKFDDKGKVINAARRENVQAEFTAGTEKAHKKKRARFVVDTQVATDSDYRETEFVKVLRLRCATSSDQLEAEKVSDTSEVLEAAEAIHKLLVERGFPSDMELLYVTGSRNSRTVGRKMMDNLRGIYHRRPDEYNGRPYFQKTFTAERNANVLGCSGHRISWSETQKLWKIGQLDENKAGFAVNSEDKSHPADLEAVWRLWEPKAEEHHHQEATDGAAAGETAADGENVADGTNTNKDLD